MMQHLAETQLIVIHPAVASACGPLLRAAPTLQNENTQ